MIQQDNAGQEPVEENVESMGVVPQSELNLNTNLDEALQDVLQRIGLDQDTGQAIESAEESPSSREGKFGP